MGGSDCYEPCGWRCELDATELVTLAAASVELDCSAATPMAGATVDFTVHAPASGADIEIEVAVTGLELEKDGTGFTCGFEPLEPVVVGPLAPGSSEQVSFDVAPFACGDPTGDKPEYDTCAFGYCTGGDAWVYGIVTARSLGLEVQRGLRFEVTASGAAIPLECSGN
jgi:hypothetical protein